jgi:hypothetical protein
MNPMRRIASIACLAISGVVSAQGTGPALEARLEACAAHADEAARLKCFDLEVELLRMRGRAAQTPAEAGSGTPDVPASAPPAAAPAPAPAKSAATPAPAPVPQPDAAPASDLFAIRKAPSREEQRDALLTARAVKATASAGGPELRIELDNGQVWVENEHKANLSIAVGEEVRIKPAAMGSFVLLAESGLSTRVRRIR